MIDPSLLTGFVAGLAVSALLGGLLCWLLLRQQRELIDARLRGELDAAHAAEMRAEAEWRNEQDAQHADERRAEAERRASAEQRNLRIPELEEELRAHQYENTRLQSRTVEMETRLEAERQSHATKLRLLEDARTELSDAFQALSAEALRHNNQSFLELANVALSKFQETARGDLDLRQQAIDALVAPMRDSLEKVDGKINALEQARIGAYESLTAQVRSLVETQHQLRGETANLVNALRQPNTRGRWGEIQLRRVVELAGMLNYCDFTEQTSVSTEDGRLRPDMLVRLPAGKTVVVDSKAPIDAYFESVRTTEELVRLGHLKRHAGHIRGHVDSLSRKAYWEQFDQAPEFVVLFLPGENFFSAALEQDPSLIEHGVERKIIIATPTTLIALLRAVFYGWRQEALSKNALEISTLGRELYKRVGTLAEHLGKLGASLDGATRSFNSAVGSIESRVLVTARKLQELDASEIEAAVPFIEPLDHSARRLEAEEFSRDGDSRPL